MDKIDEALSLSSFGAQFRAIKALVRAAGDHDQILSDQRIKAWTRVHRDAIAEMIFMSIGEAMNNTIASQISMPPVTPKGNRGN